ncbi:MAG: EAL domain-containing protein [Arthrobacter oryzae]
MTHDVDADAHERHGYRPGLRSRNPAPEGIRPTAADARRTWSLKREWSKAFVLMLVTLLVGVTATLFGVSRVTDQVLGTGDRLRFVSETVTGLRSTLEAHEQAGIRLLAGSGSESAEFLEQQNEISRLFDDATAQLPAERMRAAAVQTEEAWQAGLRAHSLWGGQVPVLQPATPETIAAYAAGSAGARAMLSQIERFSFEEMDAGLADATELHLLVFAGRCSLLIILAVAVLYLRRRLITFLIRPVEDLRRGVQKLQKGDYSHRVDVVRRDELGELAEAFNTMAEAVQVSHRALSHRANHDPLTGLGNRTMLTERLAEVFRGQPGRGAGHGGLLIIDVDNFKAVNDSLGHEGGDALLIEFAHRLRTCLRAGDLVARLGGDEFAVVVMDDGDGARTTGVAARIHESLHTPFTIGDVRLKVSASMGAAERNPATGSPAELLRQADFAMYMAKRDGKGRYQLFDARGDDTMSYRAALRTDLPAALAAGQLGLDYQPVIDLGSGAIVGVEALVRWDHPTQGRLSPADFMPLAEETGDIDEIGVWVLETAVRQVAGWRRSMSHCKDLWVSVNVSALQLTSAKSLARLEGILADPTICPQRVVLEVTETALATNIDGGITAINRLKSHGARLAIDDFGTGYSSLSTLAALPADILKVDRSFLAGHSKDAASAAMLEGILGLAGKLQLEVIVEGVEDVEQLDVLRGLGCGMGQGYFLAGPGPSTVIEALLAAGTGNRAPDLR